MIFISRLKYSLCLYYSHFRSRKMSRFLAYIKSYKERISRWVTIVENNPSRWGLPGFDNLGLLNSSKMKPSTHWAHHLNQWHLVMNLSNGEVVEVSRSPWRGCGNTQLGRLPHRLDLTPKNTSRECKVFRQMGCEFRRSTEKHPSSIIEELTRRVRHL